MTGQKYTCAKCPFKGSAKFCVSETGKSLASCPTKEEKVAGEGTKKHLEREGDLEFYLTSLTLKGAKITRVMETIIFAKKMGYSRLGLAFCSGLAKEAKTIASLFETHGFEVVSIICKVGRNCEGDFRDDPSHDGQAVVCNPVQQAKLMNDAGTEYNIVFGLCVGHDSLFMKYSDAMSTVLVAKDRVLGHNPLAAVYTIDNFYSHLKKVEE